MGPTGSVAWERAMKIQEVILRAMAKRISRGRVAQPLSLNFRVADPFWFFAWPEGLVFSSAYLCAVSPKLKMVDS
jgi:hypothetical protein